MTADDYFEVSTKFAHSTEIRDERFCNHRNLELTILHMSQSFYY